MNKSKLLKSKNLPQKLEGYGEQLRDMKSILQRGLSKAYQAVDNLKVQIYWQIGERIVREELAHKERANYGKRVIVQLAIDLKISKRLIFEIVQFFRAYPIVHALRA